MSYMSEGNKENEVLIHTATTATIIYFVQHLKQKSLLSFMNE
jgi:hypothetical protein